MDEFADKPTIVSHSGTRHLISDGGVGSFRHQGRVTTQCGMGLKPDADTAPRVPVAGDLTAGPFIATEDCVWCLSQLRYGPAIRELIRIEALKDKPRAFITVTEIVKATKATIAEVSQAVAGSPDLYWATSGISVLCGRTK